MLSFEQEIPDSDMNKKYQTQENKCQSHEKESQRQPTRVRTSRMTVTRALMSITQKTMQIITERTIIVAGDSTRHRNQCNHMTDRHPNLNLTSYIRFIIHRERSYVVTAFAAVFSLNMQSAWSGYHGNVHAKPVRAGGSLPCRWLFVSVTSSH